MSTSQATALLRAAALGAATGARSTAGVAAVAFTSYRHDRGLAGRLASTTGVVLAGLLAAGEVVADKLPSTPSRTDPPGLAPRALFGVLAAATRAHRDRDDVVLAGLVGLGAALGATALGVQARASAADRFGADLPGAVAEDGAAALLAGWGARRMS